MRQRRYAGSAAATLEALDETERRVATVERLTEAKKPETEGATESFSDPDSLSGRVDAVHRSFSIAFPSSEDANIWNHVDEIYEDRVLASIGEDIVEVPYTVSSDGTTVDFGDPAKVKIGITTTAISEAKLEPITEIAEGVHILEALDEKEGRVWRVVLVRPGISGNQRRYTAEVLSEAVGLYEGAKAFDGHRDDATRKASAIGNIAGWHDNVGLTPDGAIVSDFHISEAREDLRTLFLSAWKSQRQDLVGFSHDIGAFTESVIIDGKRIKNVRKIVEVHSVDVVADPSAGGRIERLVASRHKQEDQMTLEEFLRALRAGDLSTEQLAEAYEANPDWEQIAEAIKTTEPAPTPEPTPAPAATPPVEPVTEVALTGAVHDMVVANEMDKVNLPAGAREALAEALTDVTDEATIISRITETSEIWSAALAGTPAALPGQGVTVGEEDQEKRQKALDGMLMGRDVDDIPAFRSIKEAYSAFTGKHPYGMGDEDYNRWILAESVGAVPYAGAQRLVESLTTGSWTEALGDSIRRALVAEYSMDALGSWRQIVSEVANIPDFRTNRRVRVGGFDVLPTVAEGGSYTSLTSPTDEEATYAGTKKGGTEDLTLETISNDDLGAVRSIPRKMGRAAALTLYRAIWNTTIAGNAVIYDSDPLFDAAHTNTTAIALSEAGITALRTLMVKKQIAGETSGFIGLVPKFLAVPTDLYVEAFKLAESNVAVISGEDATTPNPHKGLTVIEVPTFTDADDWYLVADPQTVPTIEVGYYQGRQDPELFIQDQPAVGSVFTADKVTYKIRHIWGLAVLDFRGFQRGTV